jgi:hypothetical protein
MKSDAQFLKELEQATEGLLFMSESDYPFQIIQWNPQQEITPEYLRIQTSGAGLDTPVTRQSVNDFFRAATSEPAWKKGVELETARKYQFLVRLLKETLSDLVVYRVGAINITIYIIGKSETGNWLGLTTQVVET